MKPSRKRRAKKTSNGEARAKVARLMDLMREANGRLVVAAVHAQNMSDEARAAAAETKSELDELTKQLRDANQRLATIDSQAPAMAGQPDRIAATPGPGHLTPRQREVLQLVAEGKSNKEIATILGMTARTAETHRTQIMARLDLHSISELVRYAIRNRVIKP
jgi:DNA-binding CsgD family transcriptional regulator